MIILRTADFYGQQMPHKFGINSPYHARWVPSVKHISQKAIFKRALAVFMVLIWKCCVIRQRHDIILYLILQNYYKLLTAI